jgi:hypothetical protein
MMIGLAGSRAASERLGRPGALRPERPQPEPARSRPGTTATKPATDDLALPSLARAHFLIHQLLAEAPELAAATPSRPRTLAAYQAQLAHRIHYSGPVAAIDLRV